MRTKADQVVVGKDWDTDFEAKEEARTVAFQKDAAKANKEKAAAEAAAAEEAAKAAAAEEAARKAAEEEKIAENEKLRTEFNRRMKPQLFRKIDVRPSGHCGYVAIAIGLQKPAVGKIEDVSFMPENEGCIVKVNGLYDYRKPAKSDATNDIRYCVADTLRSVDFKNIIEGCLRQRPPFNQSLYMQLTTLNCLPSIGLLLAKAVQANCREFDFERKFSTHEEAINSCLHKGAETALADFCGVFEYALNQVLEQEAHFRESMIPLIGHSEKPVAILRMMLDTMYHPEAEEYIVEFATKANRVQSLIFYEHSLKTFIW